MELISLTKMSYNYIDQGNREVTMVELPKLRCLRWG